MTKLAVVMLLLTVSAGCAAAGENSSSDSSRDMLHFDTLRGKYDPPVTLTTVGAVNPDVKFMPGENLEYNVHTRWAEERLGIKIRYQWTIPDSNGAYANKLRLEISRGNLPDIVTTRDRTVIQELIDSGQFMETDDLFEKWASPVWKNAMEEDPRVWDLYKRAGKPYAIPILDYGYTSDSLLWIRTDWLKKLNLSVPSTMDELDKVLDAFTHKDPDGDGADDTYGLTVAFSNGPSTWMGDSSWIFGAYGTVPAQWNMTDDGRLQYGSVAPGAKEALGLMNSWVDKGYISPKCEWYDETKAASVFTSGKAGIIAGPYWMSGWPLSELTKQDPSASFEAIPIPTGLDGHVARRGSRPVNGAILINKNMKHPEIWFTYQNYLFDYYAESKGEFAYGLAKDYDWAMVNGVPTTDLPGGGYRVASYTLTFDGARIPSKVSGVISPTVQKVLLSQKDASKKEQFTGPPTATMRSNWELLRNLEDKTFQEMVFGNSGISFESFVQKWSEYGGDRITKEVNEWYWGNSVHK